MDSSKEKGISIFLDVFRRADKNDDSALSWDEFRSFFMDGVLSEEELTNLFHEIDTHNTNNIDTEELCTYFSKHLGSFRGIFRALEDLNQSVTEALSASAQEYPQAVLVEQFTTRFLLREITNQLTALQRPLDAAADALDEKSLESSSEDGSDQRSQPAAALVEPGLRPKETVDVEDVGKLARGSVVSGRVGRRARKQFSTQTSWTIEGGMAGSGLGQQVERLRSLVDRLENKINFGAVPEEEFVHQEKEDLIVVVSRRMQIAEGHEKPFRNSLRNYMEAATELEECLSVSVRSYTNSPTVAVFEVWKCFEDWQGFCAGSESKTFRHSNIDHLSVPEQINSIKLPSSWWVQE